MPLTNLQAANSACTEGRPSFCKLVQQQPASFRPPPASSAFARCCICRQPSCSCSSTDRLRCVRWMCSSCGNNSSGLRTIAKPPALFRRARHLQLPHYHRRRRQLLLLLVMHRLGSHSCDTPWLAGWLAQCPSLSLWRRRLPPRAWQININIIHHCRQLLLFIDTTGPAEAACLDRTEWTPRHARNEE